MIIMPRCRVYLTLVLTMILWGGTWPVGRLVAGAISPCSAALLRFLMATAVLVPICIATRGRQALRVPRRLIPQLCLLGATGIFGYSVLFFFGLKRISASRAALIVGCIPVSIALGTALIQRRFPAGVAVLGILLSLAGVSVVIGNGNPLSLLRESVQLGDLMILGCVVCWTLYTLSARPIIRQIPPLIAVTWSCILGTALLLPFALSSGLLDNVMTIQPADWLGIAYLGIAATGLSYYWYYEAISNVGPLASGIFINLVPLFGVIFSCLFLKEILHVSLVAGGVMIIGGVIVTTRAAAT